MAIQIPNVGTGNAADQTGDNEWLAMKKVADNFSDTTHAANKLVGTTTGLIPLSEQTFKAAFTHPDDYSGSAYTEQDVNDLEVGSYSMVRKDAVNAPSESSGVTFWVVMTLATLKSGIIQIAMSGNNGVIYTRGKASTTWSPWTSATTNPTTYKTTTAIGANVAVDSTGKLMRSTSSERYKDIIGDLILDTATYNNAMSLNPIAYRSTAEADNPLHHFYSFSAEALGAFDKAFTFWRLTEQVEDAEGNITEQPLAEPIAEGINLNALLAFSHAIAIKQHKMISKQQAKIDDLDARLKALEPKPEA